MPFQPRIDGLSARHLEQGFIELAYVLHNDGDEAMPAGECTVQLSAFDPGMTTLLASQGHVYDQELPPQDQSRRAIHLECDPGDVALSLAVSDSSGTVVAFSDTLPFTVPPYQGSAHHDVVDSDADFFLEVAIQQIEVGPGALRAHYSVDNTGSAAAPAGTTISIVATEQTSGIQSTQDHPLTEDIHPGHGPHPRYLTLVVDPGTWEVQILPSKGNFDSQIAVITEQFSLGAAEETPPDPDPAPVPFQPAPSPNQLPPPPPPPLGP